MMKYIFISLALLCMQPRLHAKTRTDSLTSVLQKGVTGKDKVNTLNLLCREYFAAGQHDSANAIATRALILAEKNNYDKGIALACNLIGNVSLVRADYPDAYKKHARALKIQLRMKDDKTACDSYNNLGLVLYYQGNFPEALKYHLSSLKLGKKMQSKTAIGRSYSNIGGIHVQQGNYDEALDVFKKGLAIQKELNDQVGIGRSLNNIASVYFIRGDFKNAILNFEDAAHIKETTGDILSIGRTYLNLGDLYFRLGHDNDSVRKKHDSLIEISLSYFQKSISAFERIGDKQATSSTYNNLGLLFVEKKDPVTARKYIDRAFAIAREIGSKDDIKSSYNAYAVVDSMTGNFKQSLADYKLFIAYRDSLVNEVNTRKTVEAQKDFEFEQKEIKMKAAEEKRIALYEERILRQQIIGWSTAGILVFVLLIVILLVNRKRLKQKHRYQQTLNTQQKQQAVAIMDAQEQERKRIAEDLHDSLGHLLSTARLSLQALPSENNASRQTIQLIDQASQEVRNISFNLMPNVLEEEGLISALNELAEKTRQSKAVEISFQAHQVDSVPDKQTSFNIYRIVQEAINNILKHAGATEVNIQLIGQPSVLSMMIEDNGKGFEMQTAVAGRGLKNIKARTEWLHGNLHIDSTPGHGTTISVEIPVYA